MKSVKFILAFFLFATLLTACTSDSVSVDEELYVNQDIQAWGDDSSVDIMRTRD